MLCCVGNVFCGEFVQTFSTVVHPGAFLEIEAGGCSKVQKKNGAARAILRPRIYCGVSFIHPGPPPCSLAAKKYSTLPKKRAAPTILL